MKDFRFHSFIVLLIAFVAFAESSPTNAQGNRLTVRAVNKLDLTRRSQTIEISAGDLAPLGEKDLTKIHVQDSSGKELLTQAVDTDYDEYHKPDIVIFQADFG